MPPELIDGLLGRQQRSTQPTAMHRAYENKKFARGILSGKVASYFPT
jgi:hypothetical protein